MKKGKKQSAAKQPPPTYDKKGDLLFLKGTYNAIQKQSENAYPDMMLEAIRAVVSSLEEKDTYTHGHSIRVAEYSVIMAEAIGLSQEEVREVELSAILHDIGKIGIPDHILLKPARLTKAEFEIMKSHPVRSAKIIEKFSACRNLIPGIKYHHERFDGLGYPDGLKGEGIPLTARIILIADTYDAMTSTRPYRLALDKNIAFEELRNCAGTQFDPVLVEAFIKSIQNQEAGKKSKKDKQETWLKRIA